MRRTLRAYGDWLRKELGGGCPRGLCTLPPRTPILAHLHLCAKPAGPRLDKFLLADVQTGFGAFVAFYLADLCWTKGQVGLALTTGTLAAVLSQIPGGALVDAMRWKR